MCYHERKVVLRDKVSPFCRPLQQVAHFFVSFFRCSVAMRLEATFRAKMPNHCLVKSGSYISIVGSPRLISWVGKSDIAKPICQSKEGLE
jgi:hypothetical protein